MLEGGAMSRIEIEKKICELRKQYHEDIAEDKKLMDANRRESARVKNKMAALQQRLCELKEERITIQQRLSAKFEQHNKDYRTQRENLKALEQSGLI